MHIKYKFKVHALETSNAPRARMSNSTFYETRDDAERRAQECIRGGCEGIVIYKAITVVTPIPAEVCHHSVE